MEQENKETNLFELLANIEILEKMVQEKISEGKNK